jgi:hypothetical protein
MKYDWNTYIEAKKIILYFIWSKIAIEFLIFTYIRDQWSDIDEEFLSLVVCI